MFKKKSRYKDGIEIHVYLLNFSSFHHTRTHLGKWPSHWMMMMKPSGNHGVILWIKISWQFFFLTSVRQKVLEKKNHELIWPGKGTFKLTVQLPTAPDKVQDAFEEEIPTKVSQNMSKREVGCSAEVCGKGITTWGIRWDEKYKSNWSRKHLTDVEGVRVVMR